MEVFNPDSKKEFLGGAILGIIYMAGMALVVGAFFVVFTNKILGDILWLLGAALIIFTLIKNIQSKHGKGFKTANIIMKIAILALVTFLVAVANTFPG